MFYYEVTVLNQGLKGYALSRLLYADQHSFRECYRYIAVGLTDTSYPLNKQPVSSPPYGRDTISSLNFLFHRVG